MDLLTLSCLCTFVLSLWLAMRSQRRHWTVDYFATALLLAMVSVQVIACASLRPQIQAARDDFVLACRELTQAMVGDGTPSKAERIAQKVCLVEQMGETIEHAIVADGSELFEPDPPPALAPVPTAPTAPEAPPAAK